MKSPDLVQTGRHVCSECGSQLRVHTDWDWHRQKMHSIRPLGRCGPDCPGLSLQSGAFGMGRVTAGEPVPWRAHPVWANDSGVYLQPGTDVEILDVSGDFVLARLGRSGVPGQWLERERVTLPTVVRSYRAGSQEGAVQAFQIDAAQWARRGYYPTTQSWAPGSYGCGAFLVALLLCVIVVGIIVFIYMLVVKPEGTLTVTYEFRAPQLSSPQASIPEHTESAARPTKRCPQCAEDVLAEARICRFCHYEFNQTEPPGSPHLA
jgi:hypothetical protein